ncbi:MAG: nucleotidyltransferase domain-containing protein [Brevundimonas sp.]|uniref:nucleotidyltransferase domain-containing protein n=1 Tax=Brevundimonas sp. TaxID=1871086 RepID=UPI0026295FED|nr:nucleotidyltransferase domain-containing protein [Brevundimonas sp.]MDI6624283.1 nucleotidyltransferase domain-containing protein [Brevundimonas sp.]MDQ7811617.1 nucleotidyltransferase domain-containing protein [Brevundimonas sp.]
MTAQAIIRAIAETVGSLRTRERLDAFVFGSALDQQTTTWSDIDILLICELEADGLLARESLAELSDKFPIDLTIMLAKEEMELDFIRSERCRWLTSSMSE